MFGKKRSFLGLDLGSRAIKAVEMTPAGDGFQVTGFGYEPVEPAVDEAQEGEKLRQSLESLLSRARFRTKSVVTAVSGRSVIVRYVTMAQMAPENLRNAIRFEADKYIPFEIDEVVLDCQKLEDAPDGKDMKVVLVAVKKSVVEDQVRLLESVGLRPQVIDVDAFALGNAFELHQALSAKAMERDRVVSLIDIGARKTNINIVVGTTSHFTREVYIGGSNFVELVAKRFGTDESGAEMFMADPGEAMGELRETVASVTDELVHEIQLSFDFFENQNDQEVREIYVSGGASRLAGLPAEFERALGRVTRAWDPLENLAVDPRGVNEAEIRDKAPNLAIAVGLASRLRRD
ncbi:MAG: type IV pilus assembly protein PilM [Planctomycetes bacterium]|nr:type IV pilus assembly protein PilM [Planctomycetota bacterium]